MTAKLRLKKIILLSLIQTITVLSILSPVFAQTHQAKNDQSMRLGIDIPYRIAFDPTIPPYQYESTNGYEGFFIDLVNHIASHSNLFVELIPMPSSLSIEKLKNNEIHGILGVRYSNAVEQEYNFIFSESLVSSTLSIVMLASDASLIKNNLGTQNVLIAVERDSVEFEFVKNIKKANFNLAYNQESVISLLMMDRAEMVIGVRHVAEYQLDKLNVANQYVISNSYETPVDYYLTMSSKYDQFINQFNTQLRSLKISGVYESIYNQWINDKNLEKQEQFERNLFIMLLTIISVITIAILIFILNIKLKQKINQKTSELRVTNIELEKKIYEIKNTIELKDLIFESSPRSIAIFDDSGNISAMNEHVIKLCGLKKTPIGESIFNYFPLNQMLTPYIDTVYKDGERHMALEYQYEVDHIKRYLRYYLYPLFDYEKNNRGAIITIEDITEERHYKAQALERAKSKALSRLITGIAHEIRNPLTSIKTYAELIPRKVDNPHFREQISTVIPNEVERVNKLIENLIDYTKPKAIISETFSLNDVVESCLLLFKPSFDKASIRIILKMESNIFITADKNQLKQVIINIILNAIDAIEDPINGIISFTTVENDNDKMLIIKDNGIGIDKDEMEHVFELFYTTKIKGSGIGLPLSKQLVEENGGEIYIDSEKENGTTITLRFKEGQNET